MTQNTTAHVTEVKPALRNAWRATCSCGWGGVLRYTEGSAKAEAERHEQGKA